MLDEFLIKEHTKKFIKSDAWSMYKELASQVPFVRLNNSPTQIFNIGGKNMSLNFKLSEDGKDVIVSEYLKDRNIYRQLVRYPLNDLKDTKTKVKKVVKSSNQDKGDKKGVTKNKDVTSKPKTKKVTRKKSTKTKE